MLAEKQTLVRHEVEQGTGASIGLEVDKTGIQTAVNVWFADLKRTHSPIVTLRPTGLRRFRAELVFGRFAAETIRQMQRAEDEEVQLARALVASVARDADVTIGNSQTLDNWLVSSRNFSIVAEKRDIDARFDDEILAETCRALVTPLLAAMAELYGYETIEDSPSGDDAIMEGAIEHAFVRRRERNPRSRLLCLRLHGTTCAVCSIDVEARYGDAGGIIEVHHLQPLSTTNESKAYNPTTDLVPLCPNCHRAAHTKRPVPWTPEELRHKLS